MKAAVWTGIAFVAASAVVGLGLVSCGIAKEGEGAAKGDGRPVIAILTPLSQANLDDAIRGFRTRLAKVDVGGKQARCVLYTAHGVTGDLPDLVGKILRDRPALVFSLTTAATSLAAKKIPQAGIPLVFAAVTDPVKSGIVKSLRGSESPVTGVSDRYPVARQMKFLVTLLPRVRNVAILMNPAGTSSKALCEESRAELKDLGVKSDIIDIREGGDLETKVKEALAGHDCLVANGDDLLLGRIDKIAELCIKARKPLYTGDVNSVSKGALAAVGPNYLALGEQAGRQAAMILSGTRPGSIPCEFPKEFDYAINVKTAEALGVKIPPEALRIGDVWQIVVKSR